MVRAEVIEGKAAPIRRSDLPVPPPDKGYRETAVFVGNALTPRPEMRQQDVATFAHEVRRLYGDAPAERRGRQITRRTVVIGLVVIVTLMILLQLLFALLG